MRSYFEIEYQLDYDQKLIFYTGKLEIVSSAYTVPFQQYAIDEKNRAFLTKESSDFFHVVKAHIIKEIQDALDSEDFFSSYYVKPKK